MDEVGKELMDRLEWMTLKPQMILDVSSEKSHLTDALQQRYPEAKILKADELTLSNQSKLAELPLPDQSKFAALNLPDQSIDLVISNLFLPWQNNFTATLREWHRLLKPDGLLLFSALGPATLFEWQSILGSAYLPERIDMHDLGDLLLQEKFSDPVLDVDYCTLVYREKNKFFAELEECGMLTPDVSYPKENCLPDEHGKWHAVFEIVYAHAFMPAEKETMTEDGVTRVSVDELKKQLKKSVILNK